MTEQEKKILFQAICESLSYGLKCTTKAQGWPGVYPICGCIGNKIILDCPKEVEGDDIWLVQNIIPYLRPMSSMTEEECKELGILFGGIPDKEYIYKPYTNILYSDFSLVITWFNIHHLDYCGLIPMGLALPAPEGMYK